jgi:hypothetical protein
MQRAKYSCPQALRCRRVSLSCATSASIVSKFCFYPALSNTGNPADLVLQHSWTSPSFRSVDSSNRSIASKPQDLSGLMTLNHPPLHAIPFISALILPHAILCLMDSSASTRQLRRIVSSHAKNILNSTLLQFYVLENVSFLSSSRPYIGTRRRKIGPHISL